MEKEEHKTRKAVGTDHRGCLMSGLHEAFDSLKESFAGLNDEQFWSFPLQHKNNIVTLVEHSLQCLDLYACEVQGTELTFKPEKRFDIWHHSPEVLRPLMTDLPTTQEVHQRVCAVHDSAIGTIESLTNDDLSKPNPSSWWFEGNPERVRSDAYVRAISHTHAHVRQIWIMRGNLGLNDTVGWPKQHWT